MIPLCDLKQQLDGSMPDFADADPLTFNISRSRTEERSRGRGFPKFAAASRTSSVASIRPAFVLVELLRLDAVELVKRIRL
jgi:hypothetical protein